MHRYDSRGYGSGRGRHTSTKGRNVLTGIVVRCGRSLWQLRPIRDWLAPRMEELEVWVPGPDGLPPIVCEYWEYGPLACLRRRSSPTPIRVEDIPAGLIPMAAPQLR